MNRAHRDLAALARLQEKLMSWLFCVHADQSFKAINPVCYLGVVVPRMAVAGVQRVPTIRMSGVCAITFIFRSAPETTSRLCAVLPWILPPLENVLV